MGDGEEHKARDDPKIEIQERGEIFFFYRPKVGREEAHSAGDVQRLYVVLRPESGDQAVEMKQDPGSGKEGRKARDEKGHEDGKGVPEGGRGEEEVNIEQETLFRFLVLGRKSLPDPSKRSKPYWGFVELVTTKVDHIKEALQGEEYETSTRGHRTKPPARALAKGVYCILNHVSGRRNHTHLVYKLEFPSPDKPNEPQVSLNIKNEASFIIQIKNPGQPAPPNVGIQSKRKATFPAKLEAQLGSKRFSPAYRPEFLNYEGCEFILIAASDDIEGELGLELKETFLEDDDAFDFEEEPEPSLGDGVGGGGIVHGDAKWEKEALSIANEVVSSFDGELQLYAFKTSSNFLIQVRIERLTNKSGSPTMDDIEAFSTAYRARLDDAERTGAVPENISLEVSSPGVERLVRIPEELDRFKERPMYVRYVTETSGTSSMVEQDGVFNLDSVDYETRICTWRMANVRKNREKLGKGRSLSKKQKEWRLTMPFDSLRLVRLHSDI